MNRRGFLQSCLALGMAPALVRVDSLMAMPRRIALWVPTLLPPVGSILEFLDAAGACLATLDLSPNLWKPASEGMIVAKDGCVMSTTSIRPGRFDHAIVKTTLSTFPVDLRLTSNEIYTGEHFAITCLGLPT